MSERFSLANKKHLTAFVVVLALMGALCPKCGFGTRKTSKNWARCKKCDHRVARRSLGEQSPRVSGAGSEQGAE